MADTLRFLTVDHVVNFNNRAWPNLNKLATSLIEARAGTPNSAIPVSTLARMAEIDTSQVHRLTTDRPGFVRVYRVIANKPVASGIYYLPAFAELAGANRSYPPMREVVKYAVANLENIPVEITIEGVATATSVDKVMASMFPDADTTITVPVTSIPLSTKYGDFHQLVKLRYDPISEYKIIDLPVKDLTLKQKEVGVLLANIANLYVALNEALETKEIK